MSLLRIAWRSVQQRALASTLTSISMALGVALVVCVLVIYSAINESFQNAPQGYNLIVGAKGSKLQLVLNTVYHLSNPIENLPYAYYKEFTQGRFAPYVEKVVPVCLGDNYEGYRVVGTVPELFQVGPSPDSEGETYAHRRGRWLRYEFSEGRNFRHDGFFEAVIGAEVARRTGLKVGSTFRPTHGVADELGHEHDAFTVVGILRRTGTPNDRALFVNMEGFYLLEGHAKPVPQEELLHEEPASASSQSADGRREDADHLQVPHEHGSHDDAHQEAAEEGHAEDQDAGPQHAGHHDADEAPADHEHADHEHGDREDADHEHADDDHDEHADDAHGDRVSGAESGDEPDEVAEHQAGHKGAGEHDADHDHAHHDHADHGDADHEDAAHDHADDDHADDDHAEHDHANHDHGAGAHHEPLPESQREVTALWVRTRPTAANLANVINEGRDAQAVVPLAEIYDLFQTVVGPAQTLLLVLTVLIVIVAGVGILVSMYNSMNERRREIAIMRSLGARRTTVLTIVLLESLLLSLGGGLLGVAGGHGLMGLISPWIDSVSGVAIGSLQFEPRELMIVPGLVFLAVVVGFLPALDAYRTDVAKALSSSP
ncbi:MAG: ABC transporter permease [Pirellulales bacterium]|nr:ABC transporter permease [Pirellulales bacterium]